ncbi:MAG TPA: hypothetical protein VJ692_07185 [Nitrospiraceae bacterium]|nr:hypothetical protein [Nitrospiraceae bacterium]
MGPTGVWNELRSRITFTGAAPAGDYVADNSTAEGRAQNRGALLEHTREIKYEEDVIQLPDTIDRIVRRGLELIQRPDQCGISITKHQQSRIHCILLQLSRPGVDDRYLTGQGVLDYLNMTHMAVPYYARATQWLLPDFVVKSRKKRTDEDICRTLVRIDDDIIQGRHKINQFYATHGAATPLRIRELRDWVDKQQNNKDSIYRCYL